MKIYLTGATGGLGRYVEIHLRQQSVDHAILSSRLEDAVGLRGELHRSSPPIVGTNVVLIHLAALVSVAVCERDPANARAINVDGARNLARLFEAWAIAQGLSPSIIHASTGHVYAAPELGVPVSEESPVDPQSVYAKSKLASETAMIEVCTATGIPLVVARIFGLVAPRQKSQYVLPALIDRVCRSDLRNIPGLNNTRDYIDARDVARHLMGIASHTSDCRGESTKVVNVCSGRGVMIREVLDMVIGEVLGDDRSAAAVARTKVTPASARPTDMPWLVGSPRKLMQITGHPAQWIPLQDTVRDAASQL